VAHRLLKDNGVLPQHLHDRKEAETQRKKAEQVLDEDAKRLFKASEDISADVSILAGSLGKRHFNHLKASALLQRTHRPQQSRPGPH
jgi:hypothetical protein